MFQNSLNSLEYENKKLGFFHYFFLLLRSLLRREYSIFGKFFAIFSIIYLFSIIWVQGQKPQGKFLSDSVEISKPIKFVLSYRHSPNQEVFFPDTTYNFYPFELRDRTYLPTETNKKGSLDSVIYTLETFDINPVQKLSLPVFILTPSDCTAVFSAPDSVFLKQMIKGSVENLSLKADAKAIYIEPQLDYARIIGYFLGLLFIAVIIYLFFGKLIRKQYLLFLFSRRHREFITHFKRLTRGNMSLDNIGKSLVLWKKHLEWLEKIPYSSFTTKEIIDNLPNERLEEALREVDIAIYGGVSSTQMPFAMNILQDTATERYRLKRKEIAERLS